MQGDYARPNLPLIGGIRVRTPHVTLNAVDTRALYQDFLRNHLAPALRDLGFVGSGSTFRLPNDRGDHALLGVSAGRWDSPDERTFSLTVAFHSRDQWELARRAESSFPARPSATVMYFYNPDSERSFEPVGFLLDRPHDHQWTLRTSDDAPRVLEQVLGHVRQYALPYLNSRLRGERPALPKRGRLRPSDCTCLRR